MAVKPITARRRLELSQLTPVAIQREAMGEDVDLQKLLLYFNSAVNGDITDRVTAASINRTIEGASTLSITINDYDRVLLRSGLLSTKFDVRVDGLWFRYAALDKAGDDLVLTFEDREIAILRTYNKWKIAQRGTVTRAEFVYSLLREVKEIPFILGKNVIIPELHKIQPIEKYSGDLVGTDVTLSKSKGISKDINDLTAKDRANHRETILRNSHANLTIKGKIADATQIKMANIVLSVGETLGASRRLKVIAIMTAITESTLHNYPDKDHGGPSDADSAGLFQQRPGWGSYLERIDPEVSSTLFYQAGMPVERANNDEPYWFIAAEIQHPREDLRTQYAKWRVEAERFVTAFGDVGGSVPDANAMSTNLNTFSVSGPFYFYRGIIQDKRGLKVRKRENTWSCYQRLADEVDWRAFFVSGTFYWISESDLFKQLPLLTMNEFSRGVNGLDGNYDSAKKAATITLKVETGRWTIPPGAVVFLTDCGPFDGRWLVNNYQRDLIGSNREAAVTLKKPRPQLPEPSPQGNASDLGTGAGWLPTNPTYIAPTKTLITRVLQNNRITFSNTLETSDIQFGKIDERVLEFLVWLTGRGYPITITALRSDHSNLTSEGRISAHSVGKAIDIGAVSGVGCGDNTTTGNIMDLIALYQPQLGFDQLIGPFSRKCIPLNYYDGLTLSQHRNHIHVGWPI